MRFAVILTQGQVGEMEDKDGLRHHALLLLDRVVNNITFDIQNKMKNPEVKALASLMLLLTADFMRATFQYISDTYY